MNRGLVFLLLAGCTGEPGEPTLNAPSETTTPAAQCAVTVEAIGPDDPALGLTPNELFATATGLFAGMLSTAEGEVPLTLDIESDLGEIQLVTRVWEGDGAASATCLSTVEAAFAAHLASERGGVDSAFTTVFIADGAELAFSADLPPIDVADQALSGASTAEQLRIAAALQPPETWVGWLTWGPDTDTSAWFEVDAVATETGR